MPIVIVANATPTGSFTDGYATAATEAVSASSINGKMCNPGSARFPHMIVV